MACDDGQADTRGHRGQGEDARVEKAFVLQRRGGDVEAANLTQIPEIPKIPKIPEIPEKPTRG